jgi:hypothetical protein
MPHLLTLPRELRDMIIDIVLAMSSRSPPEHPRNDERFRINPWSSTRVPKERSAYRTTSFGLLGTSHQLYCETKQRIRSMRFKPAYHLDIMVVNGPKLWPTWVKLPSLKDTNIEDLHVNFRTFGGSTHCVTSSFVNDYPSYLAGDMYDLLETFLHRGPTVGMFEEGKRAEQERRSKKVERLPSNRETKSRKFTLSAYSSTSKAHLCQMQKRLHRRIRPCVNPAGQMLTRLRA